MNRLDFKAISKHVPCEIVLAECGVTGLSRHGDELIGSCPIHRGGRKDAFHVSLTLNRYHCFACGRRGDSIDLYSELMDVGLFVAAKELARKYVYSPGRTNISLLAAGETPDRPPEKKQNPPIHIRLSDLQHDHPYLLERHITPETAAQFGVGYYSKPGLHQGRIVFPIHNEKGELVAYAGRVLDESSHGKYRFPKGFLKSFELYNLHDGAS